mmetsp:Transcript_114834/g.364971  ORF Transcript_114834/g.364971 Transcript_114834/m.364971 type:complete len:305 (-) Transcript_114834:1490-2404(-)
MASQSNPTNHLCDLTLLMPPGRIGSRSEGSFFNRFLIRSPTEPWHFGGNGTLRMPIAPCNPRRVAHLRDALSDLRIDLHGVGRLEGRVPGHELEGQNAQSPPVDGVGVAKTGDQLRGEVVGGAASRVGLPDDELGQAHVGQLDVALLREQQILGLEVAVDDAALVQVLEGIDRACDVILGVPLAAMEALSVVGGIELATQGGLEEEVEGLRTVESLPEFDHKVRVRHQQDVLLIHHALLHARLDNVALADALHGISVISGLVLVQLHGAEAAAAQEADALQVLAHGLLPGLVAGAVWHARALLR